MSMTRRSILGLGLAMATAGCSFAPTTPGGQPAPEDTTPPVTPKVDGDLVYFNWADYVDPEVFAAFEAEYKVKVIQSNFDSMESMVAKMNSGNAYDIIFPSAKWTQKLVAGGKLRKLDLKAMRHADAVYSGYSYFADPWYDAKSAHSVPFTMYKTGIGWRKDKLGELSGSWADLWNPAAKGSTFLLDDRDEVLGMIALKLGLPINTAEPGDLQKISAEIKGLRPSLRGFSSDDWGNLLNGSAHLTQAWSGDMVAILNEAEDASLYDFLEPKEGSPVNTDCYAIPMNAAHPGTAALFIDFMLRPENVVKNMTYIGYPMPVKGTESDYEALVEALPQCVVTVDDLKKDLMFQNGGTAAEQARDKAWTDAKAG